MSRSTRDSDDDFESNAATSRMQTRTLTVQSVSSPLRRSSRIKQIKYSPGSESDSSSISNSQTIRGTKTRTATMDFTVSDTKKKLRSRKFSISSDISEVDVEIPGTPGKRTTRQSSGAPVSTPTRINTRAASKRLIRAVSETQSPSQAARTTRQTRASSVGPESLFDQNKNQSDLSVKRRRASMLPSSSLTKEQIEFEDRIPYVRLDTTIVEADEIASSGNSDFLLDKAYLQQSQKIKKCQSIDKDEIEEGNQSEEVEISTDSSKDETHKLLEKKDETQAEDMDRTTVKNTESTLAEGQYKLEKTPPSNSNTIDKVSIYSSSSSGHENSAKKDKTNIFEESLSDVEKSLIDMCESTKVLRNVSENLLDTSTEEQKSDKENYMLNIKNDMLAEETLQSNVTSSCIKSLTLPFMNKSLGEKETKSLEKELSKRRRSRESIEIPVKHDNLLKEADNNSQENMDISTESLNSTVSNKTILTQHDSTKLVEKVNKDEISIENISISTNESITEVTSESDKIDKKEYTIIDNKNSNKIESDKVNRMSCSSISPAKSTQIENRDDNRESFTSIPTDDNNIKLTLEERSLRDENEISSNIVHSEHDQLVDLQISSPISESSNDRAIITEDKVIDSSDSPEEKQREKQEKSKRVIESAHESSCTTLETHNLACDSNDTVIHDQFSGIIETLKQSTMDISPEKTDVKDILPEKIVKQNLKCKSTDVLNDLEKGKENLQMEPSQKDQGNVIIADDVSDVDGIDLFQDIPANKWKEKNDDVKTDSVQSISQSVREENDNEVECDLILVNKRAWLAAETIKAAKETESFEYDSDDTVLLKSRLDAAQASYNAKKLNIVDEELLIDTDNEENEKQVKKRKSRTKRRLASEIDQDSFTCVKDEDNLVTANKSFNESKTALNRINDQSISRLNKSEQLAETRGRSSKVNNESNKEIGDDASKLNRSWPISKKNTSLRKSVGERTLNKSSKDTSMQNVSTNKFRMDDSEGELGNTDTHIGKKLYKKKRSLNKSCYENTGNNASESEKKNMSTEDSSKKDTSLNCSMNQESKPINTKTMIHLNNDENDSNISIATMNFGSKTCSVIGNVGSDSNDQDERDVLSHLFASSDNDTDDSGSDSDINREYNLDGVETKFSDDDISADECRTSETEFSVFTDNYSDLIDFIVDDDDDDDYVEDEEEIEDIHDKEDESENEQNVEKDKTCEEEVEDKEDKHVHIDTESINAEDKNKEDNEDIQKKNYAADREKDTQKDQFDGMKTIFSRASTSGKLSKIHKSKNESKYISPCKSETEMKQDIKVKKSSMEKNEKTVLLDSSDLDLSIKKKKKKSVQENDTILSDDSNLISSSVKKKRKSDPQYSSKNETERKSSEQLNKYEFLSPKKLSKSRELMKFSTPNHDSCKKLELNEIFEKFSENKHIESDNTIEATQNTLVKEKSKKDSILNEDINLKFSYRNKEKMLNNDFSPDLLKLLERTSISKSTSSKIELHKTMNPVDTETPTIKHLRKEKLNESAPILKSNVETNSLSTRKKDTAQIKKEKNKDKVSNLIIPSNDNAIQKYSQKKQKKCKKRDASKENIDEILPENAIELNVPKNKKTVKLTQLTIVDDNIREDIYQISKKKKKKKKKQDTSRENITDKALSEDIELKILKKKKPVKFTQLSIIDDDTREGTCQVSEKKKKKKQDIKENITDEVLSEDIELKISKKKKRAKHIQLPVIEDNIREDMCQINEKKEKQKKQETLKKNITNKALFKNAVELKTPKKKKCAKLNQLATIEDNTCKSAYQINEEEKKKKKGKILKENITEKALSEDVVKLKIFKKKKRANLNELAIVQNNTRGDAYHINEKEKKKKKKQINIAEKDENVNEDNILWKNIHENKTELAQQKKKNKVVNSLKLDSPTDEHVIKKKTKQQETVKSIETLRTEKKKNTLPVQIPVSKLKSDKNLLSRKLLQKTVSDASGSKNVVYTTKKLDETAAKVCIPKELKSKKKRDRTEDIENTIHVNVSNKKSKKEVKEVIKPSSNSLKRLSDEVIENLPDMPMRPKKRQKISRNEEQIVSSIKTDKSKMTTVDYHSSFTLSTSGCNTQFHVVNLQNTKKQHSKGTVIAASFRQRMLARNNREPISAYMMYHDKMASSNNKFFSNMC